MKKQYNAPKMETMKFDADDIIRTSGNIIDAISPETFEDAVKVGESAIDRVE